MLINPVTVTMSRHDLELLVTAARLYAEDLERRGNGTTRRAQDNRDLAERVEIAADELTFYMEAR